MDEFMGGGCGPVDFGSIHTLASLLASRFDPPLEYVAMSENAVALHFCFLEDRSEPDPVHTRVTVVHGGVLRLERAGLEKLEHGYGVPRNEVELEKLATSLAAIVHSYSMREG